MCNMMLAFPEQLLVIIQLSCIQVQKARTPVKLQDVLKSLDLNVDDVRGQGYDNGSNMKIKMKMKNVFTNPITPEVLDVYTP